MQTEKREKKAKVLPVPTELLGGPFSLKTHFADERGRRIGAQPYRLHMGAEGELFERPVNSGNCYFSNGQIAGRMIYKLNDDGSVASKSYDSKAKHIEYVAPLSGSEKLESELSVAKKKNAALEAELAAIRSNKDAKPVVEATKKPELSLPPVEGTKA